MAKVATSVSLSGKVLRAAQEQADELETTLSWVIEAALIQSLAHKLPPGTEPPKPWEQK